ncbi:MAG: SBBP repeat-containing protein [Acidobacteriia bacterium]|nr:SBBP repeat-containing protein [Terriglobia bacterium]
MAVAVSLAGTAFAAGPGFSTLFGGDVEDYAAAVATDRQGNIYVAGLTFSSDFPVTPGAVQTKLAGVSDAFVAKFSANGKLIWSTYLGGSSDDGATGVAVDGAGNVVVAGSTGSRDFPVVNAFQPALNGGFDAFVVKLDPAGTRILYSTFLGGEGDDQAIAMAVDAGGSAYITGNTVSARSFPGLSNPDSPGGIFVARLDPNGALVYATLHPLGSAGGIAVDGSGSVYVTGTTASGTPGTSGPQANGVQGTSHAIVYKLSTDGSQKIYETSLGGSLWTNGTAIAVDAAGSAYVAGMTNSVDFPLVRSLQPSLGARPLWKSTDGGNTWQPLDDLPFAYLQTLVADPTAPQTLYAAAVDGGVFRSEDGGATWNKSAQGIAGTRAQALAMDATNPQVLYAATGTSGAVYKTADGARTWSPVDSAPDVVLLAIDAQNSRNVYSAGTQGALRKTADGGATTTEKTPGPPYRRRLRARRRRR